jgi:hypothetical protein
MPDGRLLYLRDTYPIETAWAPPWVGDKLRQIRAAAWDARLAGLRASAEAAGHRGDRTVRHRQRDRRTSARLACQSGLPGGRARRWPNRDEQIGR